MGVVALKQWTPLFAAREVAMLAKVSAGGPMIRMEGDLLKLEESEGLKAGFEGLAKT